VPTWHSGVNSPQSAGVPAPTLGNTVSIPQGEISLVDERLRQGEFAAIILEPTGASWGTVPLRVDFLADLREITTRHNTILIFDEVVTGFRVSSGGVQAHFGVTPDVTTLAKILAGGLPGGAVTGKVDILSMLEFREDPAWNAGHRVAHPGTFNANPLSAAAGSIMLAQVATGNHHQHADQLNERLVNDLNYVLQRTRTQGQAYGLASYFHIVLGKDCPAERDGIEWPTHAPPPPRMPSALTAALKRGMLNHGVDLMGGNGGFVSGVHTPKDIAETVKAFEDTVGEMRVEGIV